MNASRLAALGPPSLQERRWAARTWPTAEERWCAPCEVLSATKLCWSCGADLSDLPATQGAGTAGPDGASASAVPAPVAAGPGTNRLARVAGEGRPGRATPNGGV